MKTTLGHLAAVEARDAVYLVSGETGWDRRVHGNAQQPSLAGWRRKLPITGALTFVHGADDTGQGATEHSVNTQDSCCSQTQGCEVLAMSSPVPVTVWV